MSEPGPVHVGVDVGGTKILAGVVDAAGAVQDVAVRRTPGRTSSVLLLESTVAEAVEEVVDGRPVAAVGLAAAGFVDGAGERVMFAPHLPWRGEAVRRRLEATLGAPVLLDNDANAAGWAEHRYGAARGASLSLTVTVGTGIGGAVVLGPETGSSAGSGAGSGGGEPRLLRGRNGMAGEFGHQQVVPDGVACECGGRGCWEQYASGNALVAFARARVGREPTVLDDWCGGVPDRLTGPMVTDAAAAGDLVALQAFGHVGDWLGVGIANLVAALDPEIVVVGGGVSAVGDLLLDPARAALGRSLVGAPHRVVPPLRPAALGPEAAIVGAAALAAARFGGSPAAR
ncbi:glucokinase [Nocardioides zeae]|uniref:Glucokinase n=2 Tax=Nocardioides zeae TaxID=1457234 RepID=A0ACC6IH10_9ACTN|nr:ROK family protein [Nocardioides zeae]MDQ1103224.1 glucokinase [Nocardioides zeae]MDR6173057.1 glucokinase [Nocardioides zeae]MDR6210050.1 glucokinase [Nocardioides zeae]